MNSELTKAKVISSLFWKLLERGGTQGIQFIVTIVLARLLLPEEFGLIVLVTIFITIAGVFVQSGFNTALIQKKNSDEVDFSSVFYLSLLVASLLYIGLFFIAPIAAAFYEEPQLTTVLRIQSLTLFFGAINSIQIAVVSKKLEFKKLFISSLGAMIVSATAGIMMAYAGFGVWSLVVQHLSNQLLVTIILWFTVKWRPTLLFSFARIKTLFAFGWKVLVSSLLDTLYINLTSLFIGKMYSSATLGFYNRGEQFPKLIVSNINGSIQSVMFPTLSSNQDNIKRVKDIVRRSIVTSSFIVFPVMVGMAAVAEPLVNIVLTEKWLPAVPFLQIFCASYALWPIHTANLQAINALGRSDIFLKLEIFKKLLGLVVIAISIPFGAYAMAFGVFVVSIISTFINAYPNLKLIDYRYREQWKDIIPSLILSIIMGMVVYSIQWIGMTEALTLIVQIIVGIVIYIGLAKALRLECYTYLITTGKEMLKNKKRKAG
ncbi:lipopolysaccharide biosynthesis protein [Bacillus haimaensis]|uniref:lipopolysaccharide biosynthesis protein n=1 Tax=Bacillus haimaensis TaxID=3160967 RepID=UPI003AA7E336